MERNNKFIKKWIKALRSGEYTQGSTCLKQIYRTKSGRKTKKFQHCCLGVACELLPKKLNTSWDKFNQLVVTTGKLISTHDGSLPVNILNYIGLELREQDNLIRLNDEKGYSFTEIADHIENAIKNSKTISA